MHCFCAYIRCFPNDLNIHTEDRMVIVEILFWSNYFLQSEMTDVSSLKATCVDKIRYPAFHRKLNRNKKKQIRND